MKIDYTDETKALRKKLRAYFAELITPEVKEGLWEKEGGDLFKKVVRQMGADGWLAIGWPKEYGGQGATTQEQLAFFEEALLAYAPVPFVTLNTVGPALLEHGSDEIKEKFLPGIAAGETHFAIGYTEANAGTDLAVLNTTAVKDGDYYIINGTKAFTSSAEDADYIWLATRTTPDSRHKGITMFMVDTKLEGFSYAPIYTVGGLRTNMTYYENIRVHKSMMVGEENKGWGLIMAQLNHERVGLAAWGVHGFNVYRNTLQWCRKVQSNGKRVIDDPMVQQNLAQVYSRLEAMRILNSRMAWGIDQNEMNPALASGVKVHSTEGMIEIFRLLMECVGPVSLLKHGSEGAILAGQLDQEYRRCQINTFGGGVNEILRGLVANFGLGMPRHR